MNDFPEAPASATVKIKTKLGFEWLFTVRSDSVLEPKTGLFAKIDSLEKEFTERGWTALAQNNGFPKKEKDFISGRTCPKDGGRLFNSVTKTGRKFIKCENNKWDAMQQKAIGCDFVEWSEMTNADM